MAPITTVCNDQKVKKVDDIKTMEKIIIDDDEKENIAEAILPVAMMTVLSK